MIEKIVEGSHLKRLDNIIQWQERDVFQRESVSQHSFKVSVFTRVLLEDIFGESMKCSYDVNSFKLNCVTHALFHDFDEAIFLRDISHSVKYSQFNGEEIRNAIKHYVQHQFVEEFDERKEGNEVSDSSKMLYKSIVEIDPMVKKVVKVGDWLALFYFCRRELALGNSNFEITYEYCKKSVYKAAEQMIYDLANIYVEIDIQKFLTTFYKIINSDIHGIKDY